MTENATPLRLESVPHGERADLAHRAAGDIAEVVLLLAPRHAADLTPAIVQMVQQRVHDLACGIASALSDDVEPCSEIRERLYPSELQTGGGHA